MPIPLQAFLFLLLPGAVFAQDPRPSLPDNLPPAIDLARAVARAGACPGPHADEPSIRTLVKKFADARNAHDGQTAAGFYSQDGEWISANGNSVQGRTALAQLWSGVTGQVQRTVESVDFPGWNIAVVRVATRYPEPLGEHHEIFVFVKTYGTWAIRVHQTLD